MTFCLGMRCEEGLFALADTRITSGTEMSSARKISIHQYEQHSMFIMRSGLRSIRDKAITYFEERLKSEKHLDRLYKATNALAEEIRKVRTEDMEWLMQGGLLFDLHLIFGGQDILPCIHARISFITDDDHIFQLGQRLAVQRRTWPSLSSSQRILVPEK